MNQLGLFAPEDLVLVGDAEGGIRYTSGWLDADTASRWFDEIHRLAPWQHERRVMYEREVDVPRLVSGYALDAADLPACLAEASDRVQRSLGVRFSSVGLNLYRDGRDSVAPHADHLEELMPGKPIALVSLGGPRRMVIQHKARKHRAIHVDLESGSLLVMSHASQHSHLHGVPKTAQATAPRISLAFRVRRVAD